MILQKKSLLYTLTEVPTPPDRQLLYLQNGDNTGSDAKVRNWSIDTGIVWTEIFLTDTPAGHTPGMEVELTYSYTALPPEGGLIAGTFGGNYHTSNQFRIFGHSGGNFCFDCPQDGNVRLTLNHSMEVGVVYTGIYSIVENTQTSYSLFFSTFCSDWEETKTGSFTVLNHNNYTFKLWSDNTSTTADSACREGVRIYGCNIYRTDAGIREETIYQGVPWMDENEVPCFKDLISGELQYNTGIDPKPFLYGEIQ